MHCCTHAFQASAFDHSATHPEVVFAAIKHSESVCRKPEEKNRGLLPSLEKLWHAYFFMSKFYPPHLFFLIFLVLLSFAPAQGARAKEITPLSLPGAESVVFKEIGEDKILLHLVRPKGWKASDRRPCFITFFGGGWKIGTPRGSIPWAKAAARQGMVGVAPDYRTAGRFGTTPADAVADSRAAVRWMQDHAAEYGIDPAKIIVQGYSAGGHVGAWTAIAEPFSPERAEDPVPKWPPAALILFAPVTATPWFPALSVAERMPQKMPPTLVVHGAEDRVIPLDQSEEFTQRMLANGNRCQLLILEDAGHDVFWDFRSGEAGNRAQALIREEVLGFLASLELLPVEENPERAEPLTSEAP